MAKKTAKVLVAESRDDEPREVSAEEIDGATVRHDGRVYHHVTEDGAGRWVFLPAR